MDYAWDDIRDEPVLEYFLWKVSVDSVSRYLWIAAWIAFWITYGVNQFLGIAYIFNQILGIAYAVSLFLRIGVCRIAYC